MSTVRKLHGRNLISPPPFLPNNICYETEMGSVAYGVSGGDSDIDVYGFCIPPKDIIFPHLRGEIEGFGKQSKRFEQYQQHHIEDKDANKKYDITIYNIVKYFQLCMENNPNMIDSLYTPQNCVLCCTKIGNMVRDNRDMFLHKGSWYKFRGYAYSQMHKIKNKKNEGIRKTLVEKFGYDVKFAYHVVRLVLECEQILVHGTIDLQRDKEVLKAIRRGEWELERLEKWVADKETDLERLYADSKLQYSPDEDKIKQLLIDCLEEHYGSLENAIPDQTKAERAFEEIKQIVEKYR